jgi:hypothetical protein
MTLGFTHPLASHGRLKNHLNGHKITASTNQLQDEAAAEEAPSNSTAPAVESGPAGCLATDQCFGSYNQDRTAAAGHLLTHFPLCFVVVRLLRDNALPSY